MDEDTINKELLNARLEVRTFAVLMEEKLRKRDYRGNSWRDVSDRQLWNGMLQEMRELRDVIENPTVDSIALLKHRAAEAVDVANFAMFFAMRSLARINTLNKRCGDGKELMRKHMGNGQMINTATKRAIIRLAMSDTMLSLTEWEQEFVNSILSLVEGDMPWSPDQEYTWNKIAEKYL